MSYNIGPKIGIDGEREFRQQIKNINDTFKALEAETKAVAKAFDAQGDEQGKLEALSKQLNKQIEEQRKKQALLEDAVQKATAKFGENSIEATRLRGALYDTQATISSLESELSGVNKQLDGTEESMEDLGESTEGAADSALTFKDVMGANLIADLTLNTLKEAASFMKNFASGSLEAASDMVAAEAQFEQTFGDMQDQASAALDQISEDTNVASTRMQGSFTKIYAFAKTAGADSSESLMIASRAMAAATDSAAYYDRTIEETCESLQAFLKGNYANDAALGISATETSRNTMANQLYAKSFKELTEAQKIDTLLAMVEAGNKASGAIGQAARESDSWGNVIGELSEMFRQMQAEAGKPALKALTPAIKKLTKAGYELIEDIDWEKFGDTLANIIEGAVDHGPAILRLVSAVVAGIAAFKIAKLISNFGQAAKSLLTLGKASKAAAADVTASGAAAAASPWMMVASLIGAAVGYIGMSCLQAKDTQTAFEKITKDLEETRKSIQDTFDDSASKAAGAAESARYYAERLVELETAGLNTAVAHEEYRAAVEQLNEIMPELNLQIDESTGLITANTNALLDNIDAAYDKAIQDAHYEQLTDMIDLCAKAEATAAKKREELAEVTEELASLNADLEDAQGSLARVEKDLLATEEKLNDGTKLSTKERQQLTAQYEKLEQRHKALSRVVEQDQSLSRGTRQINTYAAATYELEKKKKELTLSLAAAEKAASEYSLQIGSAQAAVDSYTQSTQTAAAANSGLTDEQLAVKTSLENLTVSYDEMCASALEAMNSQIGMFEEVSMKSDWTAEKIIQNWESQQAAFSTYSANLEKAKELHLDDELVKQLSDGSVESMQILDALVSDTGTSVDEINAAFEKTQEAKDTVAESMAWIQGEFASQWDTIVGEAKAAGVDIVDGAVAGINNNRWKLEYAMEQLSQSAVESYNGPIDRNSPAKEFTRASKDIIDGAVIGVEKYGDLFADSMEGLALYGKDAFLQEKLDLAVSYPDMVTASTVNNSRSITNLGGFNIQIYQQPGESAENLAYRVMDIIHDEVAAKEAVFGAK